MRTNRIKHTVLMIAMGLLTLSLLSCSGKENNIKPSVLPPPKFSEADLIGTWQENGVTDSEETIALAIDHKFYQIFESLDGNYHVEQSGSWELKNAQNGCVYIYFYGMKYFYQDPELVDNGNRWISGIKKGQAEEYWDECSENIIEMPDMVVMFISQHPSYPKNIILRDMSTQRDVVDIYFSLSTEKN